MLLSISLMLLHVQRKDIEVWSFIMVSSSSHSNIKDKTSCQQPSSMSNASGMLPILDLVSLARLAG